MKQLLAVGYGNNFAEAVVALLFNAVRMSPWAQKIQLKCISYMMLRAYLISVSCVLCFSTVAKQSVYFERNTSNHLIRKRKGKADLILQLICSYIFFVALQVAGEVSWIQSEREKRIKSTVLHPKLFKHYI